MTVNLQLMSLRQDDQEFKASLGFKASSSRDCDNTVRLFSKKIKKERERERERERDADREREQRKKEKRKEGKKEGRKRERNRERKKEKRKEREKIKKRGETKLIQKIPLDIKA
jgi:hypothetical protein